MFHGKIGTKHPNWNLITSQTDVITPQIIFNNKFSVHIPERETYNSPNYFYAVDTGYFEMVHGPILAPNRESTDITNIVRPVSFKQKYWQ